MPIAGRRLFFLGLVLRQQARLHDRRGESVWHWAKAAQHYPAEMKKEYDHEFR